MFPKLFNSVRNSSRSTTSKFRIHLKIIKSRYVTSDGVINSNCPKTFRISLSYTNTLKIFYLQIKNNIYNKLEEKKNSEKKKFT